MKHITRLFILLTMFALVLGISSSASVQAAGTWEPVGPASFGELNTYQLSFAIDGGTPYVAYSLLYLNEDKITVRKFDGTDWILVGNEYTATFPPYNLSLAVDNQTPFMAYTDWDFKPTVVKFNGTDWELVGVEGFSDYGTSNLSRLVVDNGVPFIAYSNWDADWDSPYEYIVKKFDGTNWANVGTTGVSTNTYGGSSLAIDNGVLYLAFSDASQQDKASVIKFNGTDWVTVGAAGFSLGYPENISLAMDNGVPFVAYSDHGVDRKITVMKFDGTDWVRVGAAGFSENYATDISLKIHNSLPYVAFDNGVNSSSYLGGATVMKFNGSNWVKVGLPDFSHYFVHDLDLELLNGIPYIAFTGSEDKSNIAVMKFNSSTNAPPTNIALSNDRVPQNLPAGSTVGTLTAIDADPNDPHVYALACAAPGPDDAFFQISGEANNKLQTSATFSYNVKNSFNICIQTDDGSDGVYEKNFTIHVTTVVPSRMVFRSKGINDGWILERPEGNGKGGTVNSSDTTLRVGDTDMDQEYRSVLSFNTITLPDSAIVTKVTLNLKKQAIVGVDPYKDMGALLVDIRSPWFGLTAGLAKSDFQVKADMANIGSIPKNFSGDWFRKIWSTDTFFSFINLKGRTQFRLRFADGDNGNPTADYIAFYSGDYATITDRPMLIVEYYVP